MSGLRVLALTKYGRLGASSRLRTLQYIPWFEQAGLTVTTQHLVSDDRLQARYEHHRYGLGVLLLAYARRCQAMRAGRHFNLLWIEKEALPWAPLWLEQALLCGVPYVLDYDDAIFHNYDLHAHAWVRRLYGQRLDRLMARAALVVAGNQYLATRARAAGACHVEVVPTVIDLMRYPARSARSGTRDSDPPIIVWIGSPSNLPYLELLREPLQALAARHSFVLRVIGGGAPNIPHVPVDVIPWSESTEVEHLCGSDIGVMPLLDTAWEQGKCGYKLVQYMACALPVVASQVGVNPEVVRHGENGFLVNTPQSWVLALEELLVNPSLRTKMGAAGRERVENDYCIQKTGPRLVELLQGAATGR